jgi:hypothetical protein
MSVFGPARTAPSVQETIVVPTMERFAARGHGRSQRHDFAKCRRKGFVD